MPEDEVEWDITTFSVDGKWAWRALPADRGGFMGSSGWAVSEDEALAAATAYAKHTTDLVRNASPGRMVTRIVV